MPHRVQLLLIFSVKAACCVILPFLLAQPIPSVLSVAPSPAATWPVTWATERIDWLLEISYAIKTSLLIGPLIFTTVSAVPDNPSGTINGIPNPSRLKPCSVAKIVWSTALCLRPTYNVVVSVTNGFVFSSILSSTNPLIYGAFTYVVLPSSPTWTLTAVKSFSLKHSAKPPALHSLRAFSEITFGPSSTEASIIYTLELIKTLLAIK